MLYTPNLYVLKHSFKTLFVHLHSKTYNNSISIEKEKMEIMKSINEEIAMLRYQIQRYQAVRNGAKCQELNAKLRVLTQKQGTAI